MIGHVRNLQGYCDYTACRKFNHRYLSSDSGKEQENIFLMHSGLGSYSWDNEEMNTSGEYPNITGNGFSRFTDGKIPALLMCHALVVREELGDDTSESHIKEIALPKILKEYAKIKKASKITVEFPETFSSVWIEALLAEIKSVQATDFTVTIGSETLKPKTLYRPVNSVSGNVLFWGSLDIKSEVQLKEKPTESDLIVQKRLVDSWDVWCVVSESVPVDIDVSLSLECENMRDQAEFFLSASSLQPLWVSGFITPQHYVITFYNKLIL